METSKDESPKELTTTQIYKVETPKDENQEYVSTTTIPRSDELAANEIVANETISNDDEIVNI